MIRATLDVNVLASGFQDTPGVPGVLIDIWIGHGFELVISDHIVDGLVRTFQKPYFQRRKTAGQVQSAVELLRVRAEIVHLSVEVIGVGEDREDDLVLATAISGGAQYLVTGDKHLQRIGSYQGVVIITPRDFLSVLDDL